MVFNDFIRALSELAAALAWPGVVIFLLWRYRDRLGELIPRLRALPGGTKFDPPAVQNANANIGGNPVEELQSLSPSPQPGALPQAPVANQAAGLPPGLQAARTPAVLRAEQHILESPELSALAPGPLREQALSTVAGAMLVAAIFERLEAEIWASQLYVLQALNAAPLGLTIEKMRTNFYDQAAARFPTWFENYSFERYLNFLTSFGLVAVNGQSVTITDQGREYLVWRVRQGKTIKVAG